MKEDRVDTSTFEAQFDCVMKIMNWIENHFEFYQRPIHDDRIMSVWSDAFPIDTVEEMIRRHKGLCLHCAKILEMLCLKLEIQANSKTCVIPSESNAHALTEITFIDGRIWTFDPTYRNYFKCDIIELVTYPEKVFKEKVGFPEKEFSFLSLPVQSEYNEDFYKEVEQIIDETTHKIIWERKNENCNNRST